MLIGGGGVVIFISASLVSDHVPWAWYMTCQLPANEKSL